MANEVALFEGMTEVPAHLRDGGLSDTAKALGASGGMKWISIKGSVFRMMTGAQEVATNEDRGMNMVIVGSAPGYARTFYKGSYKEGVKASPACWSDNGQTPSEDAPIPQSRMCASCPQNAKGSDANTGGRACRYSARLAVMLENDTKGDLYGISIPATSIFGSADSEKYSSLQDYVKKLAGHGYDVVKVVTEFRFDTKSPVPKLMFRAVRPLSEQEWNNVQDKAQSDEIKTHIGPRKFEQRAEEAGTAAKGIESKPLFEDADEEETPAEPKRRTKRSAAKEAVKEDEDISAILDEWDD